MNPSNNFYSLPIHNHTKVTTTIDVQLSKDFFPTYLKYFKEAIDKILINIF